jgi:4a-hydroxytetrahydrobiopterin dehydratase
MDLSQKKCKPCEGGTQPFDTQQIGEYGKLVADWHVDDVGRVISKEYVFLDFKSALAFVDAIGALAEQEGHHPDVRLSWGRVVIELTTHAIHGLSENDFILAYKIDQLPR